MFLSHKRKSYMRWSHETSVSLTGIRDTISLHKCEFYTCEVHLHVRWVLHYIPYTNLFFPCHRQDGYAFMLSMSQFLPLQFSPSFTFASVVFFNLLNIWCLFSPKACYNACLSFLVFKWNRLFFQFIWMDLMLLCRSKILHNCWHVPTFNPPVIKYRLRPAYAWIFTRIWFLLFLC